MSDIKTQRLSSYEELVFEARNHDYGAFQLRVSYWERLKKSFVVAMGFLALLLALPGIYNLLKGKPQKLHEMHTAIVCMDSLSCPPPSAAAPQKVERITENLSKEILIPEIKDVEAKVPDSILQKINGAGDNKLSVNRTGEGAADYGNLDSYPSFPGGKDKMYEFIQQNVEYPWAEKESGIQGRVEIAFMVNEDGHLSDYDVINSVSRGLDAEAQHVIEKMPSWIPATRDGKPVKVPVKVPISFRL